MTWLEYVVLVIVAVALAIVGLCFIGVISRANDRQGEP